MSAPPVGLPVRRDDPLPRGSVASFQGQGSLRLVEIGAGNRATALDWPEVQRARDAGRRVEVVRHDIAPLPGIHVLHDLAQRPWPWKDGEFDGLVAEQVLEHLADLGPTMEEVCRIVKPGGLALVGVPYAMSKAYFQDWTHKTPFTEHTFDYFAPDGEAPPWSDHNFYSRARLRVERLEVVPDLGTFLGLGPHGVEKYLGPRALALAEPLFRRGTLGLRFVLRVVGLEKA